MTYNLSQTQFHYVRKLYATQQLLKLGDLLMESGDVVVNSSASCIKLYAEFTRRQ